MFQNVIVFCLLNRMFTERNVVNTYNYIKILIVVYTLYSQLFVILFSMTNIVLQ